MPLSRKIVPRNRIRVVTQHERRLHRQVHNHESLGSQSVRQDLQGIRDQQPRPSERVEDRK